jgi:hypothetical protein
LRHIPDILTYRILLDKLSWWPLRDGLMAITLCACVVLVICTIRMLLNNACIGGS